MSSLQSEVSSETEKRISAEVKSEEAENRLRESEGLLAAVRSNEVRKFKEENEELCERLAFLGSEAEECRNALNSERERHRDQMKTLISANLQSASPTHERVRISTPQEEENETNSQGNGNTAKNGDVDVVQQGDDGSKTSDSSSAEEAESSPKPEEKICTSDIDKNIDIQTVETRQETSKDEPEPNRPTTATGTALVARPVRNSSERSKNCIDLTTDDGSTTAAADTRNQQSHKINELEAAIKHLQEENATLQNQLKCLTEGKQSYSWFIGVFRDCICPKSS